MKTIKIHFIDGSLHIFKDVLEYVSGLYYFFIAQRSKDIEGIAINRDNIEYIERRTPNQEWKQIKLKKIKITNKS